MSSQNHQMRRALVGALLRHLRVTRGLQQADVARAMDVTPGAVSQWESGLTYVGLEQLEQIARFYGVKLGDLLERAGVQLGAGIPLDEWADQELSRRLSAMHTTGQQNRMRPGGQRRVRGEVTPGHGGETDGLIGRSAGLFPLHAPRHGIAAGSAVHAGA